MSEDKLRNMLTDCLKFHKKVYGYWYERPYVEKNIKNWNINQQGYPSLQQLIDFCIEDGQDLRHVYVDSSMIEDWDGYPDYSISIVIKPKSTDEEWFDEIANYLSPQWEYERYKQFNEMKREYEK